MNTKTFSRLAMVMAFTILASATARAETTALVNYQGKLKKAGTNMNGEVTIIFKIFTGETNEVCVFQESQQVVVVDGLYSTLIGKNPTLGNIEDSAKLDDAFLEVTVNGTKLKPREKFCPPAFAKKSEERWNLITAGAWNSSGFVSYNNIVYSAFPGGSIGATNCQNYVAGAIFPMPANAVQITSAQALIITNDNSSFWNYPDSSPRFNVRLWAVTLANSARKIGPDLVFSTTNNPPFGSWFSLPLSTNQANLILQPSEFLCVEIGGYFPGVAPDCHVAGARSLLLDVRVK